MPDNMKKNLKDKCKSTCSGLSILLAIGLTFGLLYAMDRLLMTNQSLCTKEQGLRLILQCSSNFSAELVAKMHEATGVKHGDRTEAICTTWFLYQNCLEEATIKCRDDGTMRTVWENQNDAIKDALDSLGGCQSNTTTLEHR